MNIDRDAITTKEERINSKQIALFGDIHGNLPALAAVYDEIVTDNLVSYSYCIGDLVGYGPQPNGVVDFIQEHNIPTVQGNYDYGVGINSDECGCAYESEAARKNGQVSITWTNNTITDDNRIYLKNLQQQRIIIINDIKIVLVHASPRRLNEYLYSDRPETTFKRLLNLVDADVLVCGHTHIPYHMELNNERHVINVGSVGKPKDGDPRACYARLTVDGTDLFVDHCRVSYDVEKVAAQIEQTDLPNTYADAIRSGTST